MVMILCWDPKKPTDASFDGLAAMPHPYALESFARDFPVNVRVVSRTKPRDFMDIGSHIIVSENARQVLEARGATVELFPITLTYRGKDCDGWFYLHLLKEVDCLDPKKTIRAGPQDAQPELIKQMALRESACEGIPVFRIANSSKIGVSDELAEELKRSNSTGVIFQKPEEWRNPALYYE
jgi:hypothetical protein